MKWPFAANWLATYRRSRRPRRSIINSPVLRLVDPARASAVVAGSSLNRGSARSSNPASAGAVCPVGLESRRRDLDRSRTEESMIWLSDIRTERLDHEIRAFRSLEMAEAQGGLAY